MDLFGLAFKVPFLRFLLNLAMWLSVAGMLLSGISSVLRWWERRELQK